MCLSKAPTPAPYVPPVIQPPPPPPEPTPDSPVIADEATAKRKQSEKNTTAKRTGTQGLRIDLNVPGAGATNGLNIPV